MSSLPRALPRSFYDRPAPEVAPELLGRILVRDLPGGRIAGRIVEVEAYRGEYDPASHAYRGRTERNQVMFGPPGHAYIYFTYGMHHCLNVVTDPAGTASAVLIRALEPVSGIEAMRRRRGLAADTPRLLERLARGPGCVARALGVTRRQDGLDLTRGPLWIADQAPERRGLAIARGPRIGIRVAVTRRWRFYLTGHPCVSGPRARHGRGRRSFALGSQALEALLR